MKEEIYTEISEEVCEMPSPTLGRELWILSAHQQLG